MQEDKTYCLQCGNEAVPGESYCLDCILEDAVTMGVIEE